MSLTDIEAIKERLDSNRILIQFVCCQCTGSWMAGESEKHSLDCPTGKGELIKRLERLEHIVCKLATGLLKN